MLGTRRTEVAPAAGTQRRRAAGPGHWAVQTPRGTHATHVAVPPQAFLSPPAARSRPRQRVPTTTNLMTHGQPEPRPGAEHSALEHRPLLRGRPSHPTPSTCLPHGGLRPRPAVGGSEATDAAAAAGNARSASVVRQEGARDARGSATPNASEGVCGEGGAGWGAPVSSRPPSRPSCKES